MLAVCSVGAGGSNADLGARFVKTAALAPLLAVGTLPASSANKKYFTSLAAYPASAKTEREMRVAALRGGVARYGTCLGLALAYV